MVRVSVVVPVLDEAVIIPRLLHEIRDLDAEIFFVDGGSTDRTPELLAEAGYRCLAAPRGRARQMNAGAAATRGDVLLFLHADTRLPSDALARVRRAVRDGAVGGSFDVRLDTVHPLLRLIGRMMTWRSRLTRTSTGDQALFVRRDTFEDMGGFADIPLFEDIDLSRRLRRRGRVVRLRPAVATSPRRWERRGIVRTILLMWCLRGLYACGFSPHRLARYYGTAR